jgi:hypothetical protein
MPPKKDVPKGLKEFLEKPENVEKRKQAIKKNKETRALKTLEKKVKEDKALPHEKAIVNIRSEKRGGLALKAAPYKPRSANQNLLALAASAEKANIKFPPELLEKVKGFTKNIPVIPQVVGGSDPGSYPYRIFNITSGKVNNISNFLPYVSYEDFKNYFPEVTKTIWSQGKFLTKSYNPRMIVSNNGKEALIFISFNRYFLPEKLKDVNPPVDDFVFISKYIPTPAPGMRDYESQPFYPLSVTADKDIPMVKKFLGVL